MNKLINKLLVDLFFIKNNNIIKNIKFKKNKKKTMIIKLNQKFFPLYLTFF